jgi:hypothetical protein
MMTDIEFLLGVARAEVDIMLRPPARSGWAKTLTELIETVEAQQKIIDAAREFLSSNGSYVASDGYWSYAVGNPEALRNALAALDGYLTKPADHERVEE